MRFRLRLFHKALFVLAIPLALQLALIFVLGALLSAAQFEVNRERHSARIARVGSKLTELLYEANAEFNLYASNRGVLEYERGIASIENIRASMAELRELVGDNTRLQPSLSRVSELVKRSLDAFAAVTESMKDWHVDRAAYQQRATFKTISTVADQLKVEVKELSSMHNRTEAEDERYEMQIQRSISALLIVAAVLNIVLTTATGIFFARGIAKRISIVRDNSILLAAGQPLKPRFSGRDEIAELDGALHDVAQVLRETAQRERAIIDNAADVICSINQEFRFTAVNPACRSLWGYDESELLGKNCLSLVDDTWRQVTANVLKEAIRSSDNFSFENQIIHQNGTSMYSLWSGCWSEKEQSLFCVVHDISDRRRLEQLKQDFIAMISHDLRTPLCSFQFFLSLIASGRWSDLPPQLIRDASNAESEANRLIALVNDLLDIAKMESGKMELSVDEVPVSAIVDRSVKSVMHLAEKHDISFRQTPKEAIVKVNEARIVQVLVNLLSNAIKFAPEKSTVDIKLEVDNDFATLSVADRGMGIAAQEQARIFNRFEQSKKKGANNYASSGLGLAICKAIVEEHGGAIGVVSTPGEGSEFWFTVPLSKQPADQHEQLHVNL